MPFNLGIYDANGQFLNETSQAFSHQYLQWNNYLGTPVYNFITQTTAINRLPMLTILPFHDHLIGTAANLLKDVMGGKYDAVIQQMALEINTARQKVHLRWGPQMEQPVNETGYDWATGYPPDYIGAYYYVVAMLRDLLASPAVIYFTWGPTGEASAFPYYPGDKVVDFIGLETYSFEDYDLAVYGSTQSFQTVMDSGYALAAKCNPYKPVMLWEIGAASSTDPHYKNAWVEAALAVAAGRYPLLQTLSYFSAREFAAWSPAGIPDFTISPSIWQLT
jgi:beta-mannanase